MQQQQQRESASVQMTEVNREEVVRQVVGEIPEGVSMISTSAMIPTSATVHVEMVPTTDMTQAYQTTSGLTGGFQPSSVGSQQISQHVTGQQLGSQHVTSQHLGSQQLGSQHMTTSQLMPTGQQLGSQHMSTGMSTQPQTTSYSARQYPGQQQQQQQRSAAAYEEGKTESTRKVSSVIVESVVLEEAPKDTERIVEVPTYEEQVTYVTKKETREVERIVNVPVVEVVERVREVPMAPVIQRVEVPEYYDVPFEVKVPVVQDRMVDNVIQKKVQKTRPIYQEVEVVEHVTREVPVIVERKVEVPVYQDEEVPVIINQTVRPIITESNKQLDVAVVDYEPEVIPVDVHVAKPVASTLEASGMVSSRHKLVNITTAQYNTVLRSLNKHLDDQTRSNLPFVAENNKVNFMPEHESQYILAPQDVTIEGYRTSTINNQPGTTSQNYQTTSQNYQTTSQNYQTTSQNYQTTSQNYQTTSQNYQPTASQNYQPTASQNYQPAASQNYQPAASQQNYQPASQNYKSSSQKYQPTSQTYQTTSQNYQSTAYQSPSNVVSGSRPHTISGAQSQTAGLNSQNYFVTNTREVTPTNDAAKRNMVCCNKRPSVTSQGVSLNRGAAESYSSHQAMAVNGNYSGAYVVGESHQQMQSHHSHHQSHHQSHKPRSSTSSATSHRIGTVNSYKSDGKTRSRVCC
ncbi:hypothetical protein GNI_073450 [Gregarina niphandrodes]|uniref:Inner membrane complex protein n=1 Tax=Gregarina niphandrodes TaxID=110365 RepID=A0A023B730_GRENI|nr:hypothetical protein GNI_073450 [Gregarina niphandrodes]EZG66947.1 hypothetical protein GNI_073450 [Gregarina niphandrodes]|eukprot:XP_011130406.1 hypothetical protein GNI_073450 [Gregarina niphandrodes]